MSQKPAMYSTLAPSTALRSSADSVPHSKEGEKDVSGSAPSVIPELPRYNGMKEAFIIGIDGGSASGKTSLAQRIIDMLPGKRVAIVSQDNFYRGLTPEEQKNAHDFNFDHPDALDFEAMHQVLTDLRHRKRVELPVYDFITHTRSSKTEPMWGMDVIIFEGILVFYDHPKFPLTPLMDLKIFVETDSDTRLARRVFRDTQSRGRTVDSVLEQYERFVKPAYDTFIAPLRKKADVIIPWGQYSGNMFSDDGKWKTRHLPALDMIVQHINVMLESFKAPDRSFVSYHDPQ